MAQKKTPHVDLVQKLKTKVVGQEAVIEALIPYLMIHQAGLAPQGRPALSALLLGSTGTGKTHLVETLAETVHEAPGHLLSIDCGEFQMDHEVAKLIGAPPGYLGHRETPAMLSAQKIAQVRSLKSPLAFILFDEIEKASPALQRLMLGMLDKGRVTLGDNSTVRLYDTVIFMTSNLGASELKVKASPMAFTSPHEILIEDDELGKKCLAAASKFFSPEFMNRLDKKLAFRTLTTEQLDQILTNQLDAFRDRLILEHGGPHVAITPMGRQWLLEKGTNRQFGARELRRVLEEFVVYPAALAMLEREEKPRLIKFDAEGLEASRLTLRVSY